MRALISSKRTLSAEQPLACTISLFKVNRHAVARIRNSFNAWWTMLIFACSFMKLILKRLGSRATPPTVLLMKPGNNDLLADQWARFLLLVPFHLTSTIRRFARFRSTNYAKLISSKLQPYSKAASI